MRLARTTPNGRLAARQRALPGRDATADVVPGGVRARRLDGDRVGVDADGRRRRPAARPRATGSRSRSPRRGRAGRRPRPGPRAARAPRDTAAWSGAGPSRRPCPDRGPPRRHRGVARARATSAGSRSAARRGAPGSAPSTPRPSRPRGRPASSARRSAAARMPGGGRAPRSPPRSPAPTRPRRRREIRPDDRRPRRVDARAEPLVDQLERRLHARPDRRHPPQDLADRLDGLDVGRDRELEPRAGAGVGRLAPVGRFAPVSQARRGPGGGSRRRPRPPRPPPRRTPRAAPAGASRASRGRRR